MKILKLRKIKKKKLTRLFHIIRFSTKKGQEKAIVRRRDPHGKMKEGQRYGGTMHARNREQAELLLAQNIEIAARKNWPLNLEECKKG